jgi:CheY-like chemotaxis protein
MKQETRSIKVLLIDDDKDFAILIANWLTRNQDQVNSIAGARAVSDDILNGFGFDGKLSPINLEGFDLALVGATLRRPSMSGQEIVPYLRAKGIHCIGISDSADSNKSLWKAGCFETSFKREIGSLLPKLTQKVQRQNERLTDKLEDE